MTTYLVLLRGINVGGKNKISMADLRTCLEELGFSNVSTYIASGNVIYSQRLGSQRTKSRLSKIVASPFYQSMTIRSWNTTTKLLLMLEERESHA